MTHDKNLRNEAWTLHAGELGWRLLGWAIVVAAFVNAAVYIAYAGNPLVASDDWYFIGAFLQKAFESGADLQDFFVKRDGYDHAQPLGKMLLLLNARWFGLDFVFEALVGLAFAAGTFLVLVLAQREARPPGQAESLRMLGLGALAACLVTLNCGMVFDWPLVTLMYLPYLLFTLACVAAWRAIDGKRFLGLAAASLAIAFAFDDVGLIMNAALAATALLAGIRRRSLRSGIVSVLLILACEMAYVVFSHSFLAQPSNAAVNGLTERLQGLWAHGGQLPELLRIVFGSTFAHFNPLAYYFGDNAAKVQAILAGLALCAHAWFWWRAFRGGWNVMVFLGVALMLILYNFIAGIVYARVASNGVSYLNEPRYMVFYLLSNVALVCMLLGQPLRMGKIGSGAACAALVALIVLQVPLSRYTWFESKYLGAYYHSMAWQMLTLGEGRVPDSCVPMLTVCGMPQEEREQAIGFLKRHRLNVFSPEFVERYRLQELTTAASQRGSDRE